MIFYKLFFTFLISFIGGLCIHAQTVYKYTYQHYTSSPENSGREDLFITLQKDSITLEYSPTRGHLGSIILHDYYKDSTTTFIPTSPIIEQSWYKDPIDRLEDFYLLTQKRDSIISGVKSYCYTLLLHQKDEKHTSTVCYSDKVGLWSDLSTFKKEYGKLPIYRKVYYGSIIVEDILQSVEVVTIAEWNLKMDEFKQLLHQSREFESHAIFDAYIMEKADKMIQQY